MSQSKSGRRMPELGLPFVPMTARVAELARLIAHAAGGGAPPRPLRRLGLPKATTAFYATSRGMPPAPVVPFAWLGSTTGVGGAEPATARSWWISSVDRWWTYCPTAPLQRWQGSSGITGSPYCGSRQPRPTRALCTSRASGSPHDRQSSRATNIAKLGQLYVPGP